MENWFNICLIYLGAYSLYDSCQALIGCAFVQIINYLLYNIFHKAADLTGFRLDSLLKSLRESLWKHYCRNTSFIWYYSTNPVTDIKFTGGFLRLYMMRKEYMRRITHSDETMVKDRKQGNISNLLKKEIPKPCKAEAIPLKPVNQEICQNPINIKLLKNFGQYLNVSEKENRLVTQVLSSGGSDTEYCAIDVTQIFHNKPTVVSDDLSHYEFTGDNDLKKTLSHMEEKFTNTSEELQAADEELAELRVALHNAKRMIEILRTENAIEISSTEHDSNRNLQKLIEELEEEKMTLNLALENSKTNESKEERKEWHQMQKDLLVAVKVANDFKMEAQKEMLKLSERITELQKRRQSSTFNAPQKSSVALYEKNFQSWEDKAWRRLMLGCERGSRRNTLLRWCQEAVAKFSLVEITNFSSSWADGKALCCLLASFYPNKLSIDEACILEAEECLELALSVGAHIGVEVRVKVSDFRRKDHPEWSLIMRYILNLYYIISNRSHC
ncbi:Cytospin-B [Dirofilaria immitis]|nr:Cytospin-B [Dirofilaria immitis]